ncbi:hypothetical protein [Nocardia sp. R6R-6]|uniref:hypothetical protein n=1 Tax=Nocardia sp. R6R-6 TaxID=3459303 RepID=UPI00403DDEF9
MEFEGMDDHEVVAALAEVHAVFDDLVEYGMDTSEIVGASDAVIDRMAAWQNVPAVPAAVREVLRLIGINPGRFQVAGDLNIAALSSGWKEIVLEFLDELPAGSDPISNRGHSLVIWDYQSSHAALIDGADLRDPDPKVWEISEGGDVTGHDSVTAFFRNRARVVKNMIDWDRKRSQ